MSNLNLESFITGIRESDTLIQTVYTNGGCYGFAKFLQELYPESELYVRLKENQYHVIVKYADKFYDINGEVKETSEYTLLTERLVEKFDMKNWDSSKNLNVTQKFMYGSLRVEHFETNTTIKKNSKVTILNQISFIVANFLLFSVIVAFIAEMLSSQLAFFYGISKVETYNITASIFIVSFAVIFSWKLLNNVVFKVTMLLESFKDNKIE